MEVILQKFAGKIDAKSLVKTVEDIRVEYLDDGFTKEDIPPILGRLMMETTKFKKLPGPQKKKLVIGVLNHLIEQIDDCEKDSEFEVVLNLSSEILACMLSCDHIWLICFNRRIL